MNYFELYELPLSFDLDTDILRKKFYELSKRFHPDFYVNESQDKQDEILELSTQNNKAYQVLSDPLKRVEYILSLYNMLADGDKHVLPQSFLMEMMDVNEALMEMEFEADEQKLADLKGQIDEMEQALLEELNQSTSRFDANNEQEAQDILLKIRDIWYREKYLMRIRESLNKFSV